MDALQLGINRANSHSLSNPAKVQKFEVLPHEFSIAGGEVGPTLKTKRFIIYEKYRSIIEGMYKE